MAYLHNRVSQKELKQRMLEEKEPRTTISFYRYFQITDPHAFRDELYLHLDALSVFCMIYVANEGINAQISVPQPNYEKLKTYLDSIPGMEQLRLNIAVDYNGKSFWVLKIKVREKIVADGIEDSRFNMYQKGQYLDAVGFNEMASRPDTIIVDMRNHYEYEVGHFKNAIEVPSDTFREQLPMAVDMLQEKKDQHIIMYCTGGIRCEKASAWMLHNGFKNVFHLEGGIINYVHQVKEKGLDNAFVGKNFVFDERLGERISEDVIAQCHQCGTPCDTHTNCASEACHLLFIQCPECAAQFNGCCSDVCKDFIALPEEERKTLRKGLDKGRNIFNKSKQHQQRLRIQR